MSLILCCAPLSVWAEDKVTLLSNVILNQPEPWFGGLSGMEISQDGNGMTLLTDRGSLIEAHINRQGGRMVGITLLSQRLLRHANTRPLQGGIRDSEGLAIGQDGEAFISFEFRNRVTGVDLSTGITRYLPVHPDFEQLGRNAGLEALAIHPDGRLFTLPEVPSGNDGKMGLYVYENDRWTLAYHLAFNSRFLPVGADFDPDGRLYLLERKTSLLGFRSRVRRFDFSGSDPVEETLFTSFPGAYDNLEALSVWVDTTGAIRLTMASDDNFLSALRSQIVEYSLTE